MTTRNGDWKPHFAVECSCREVWFFELSDAELKKIQADKSHLFSLLDDAALHDMANFYHEHQLHGHTLCEKLVALAAIPKPGPMGN